MGTHWVASGQSLDRPALKDVIVLGKMGRRMQRAPGRKTAYKFNATTIREG